MDMPRISYFEYLKSLQFFQNPTRTEISGFDARAFVEAAVAARSETAEGASAATTAGEAGAAGTFVAAAASAGAAGHDRGDRRRSHI